MPFDMTAANQASSPKNPKSILYIPAHKEAYIEKAKLRGADIIALDLEDAVPEALKTEARSNLLDYCQQHLEGQQVWVRVNRPWMLLIKDLEAIVDQKVSAIIIPKTDNAARIQFIAEALADIERQKGLTIGHTGIIGFIESVEGLYNAREIAAANPRMLGLGMGTEDLALEMGMQNTLDTLYGPCQQLVMAARAANIQPIGLVGSMAEFRDIPLYQEQLNKGFELGFSAAFCIHPAQIEQVNTIYQPDQRLLNWADRVMNAWQKAQDSGEVVFEVDGKMIDWPVILRAKKILGLSE